MRFVPTSLADIPMPLMVQKTSWNIREFIKIAAAAPNHWHAFLIEENSEVIGFITFVESKLYDCLVVETMCIDRSHRSVKNLRNAVRGGRKLGIALAESMGLGNLSISFRSPKALNRLIGERNNMNEIETLVREEVGVQHG